MSRSKAQKANSRARILDAAQRQFRNGGIEASGLAGIMSEAELTPGAFYAHFASKDDLVAAALDTALTMQLADFEADRNGNGPLNPIASYLSAEHRDTPGQGCASAALLAEVARQSDDVRAVYTSNLRNLLDRIAGRIPPQDVGGERGMSRAMAVFGMLVGCMQMARAVNDPDLSNQILQAGIEAATLVASS